MDSVYSFVNFVYCIALLFYFKKIYKIQIVCFLTLLAQISPNSKHSGRDTYVQVNYVYIVQQCHVAKHSSNRGCRVLNCFW